MIRIVIRTRMVSELQSTTMLGQECVMCAWDMHLTVTDEDKTDSIVGTVTPGLFFHLYLGVLLHLQQ